MSLSLVVALDRNRGIGIDGKLPWKLPGDMRFFREITTCPDRTAVEKRYGLTSGKSGMDAAVVLEKPDAHRRNAVILGRHTWESLPAHFKPLPDRVNIVLSRRGNETGAFKVAASLPDALSEIGRDESIRETFVIGGAQVYAGALKMPECERIYLTEVDAVFSCDAFFPELPAGFSEVAASDSIEENGLRFRFRLLKRMVHASTGSA